MPEDAGTAETAEQRIEAETRRNGRYMRRGAIAAAGTVIFIALTCRSLPGGHALPDEIGFASLLAAALTFAAGMWERANRPMRLSTRLVQGRLDQIERNQANIWTAITAMAGHLPDALERANWVGFNSAVREGFGLTGTDGSDGPRSGRASHLGLVPPDIGR